MACTRLSSRFGRLAAAAALLFSALTLSAQNTQVHDASSLKPPAGSRVAMIEFADMECPVCGRDNPTVAQAAAKYHIPWVRRDFPLKMHAWSFQAAVNARWFDLKSKAIGDAYRDAVFANQSSIYSPLVLNSFTQKFAQQHGLALPFAIDPQGKLTALVQADYDLGTRVGIDHTPTLFIVTDHGRGQQYYEVSPDMHDLYQLIDRALVETRGK